MQQTASNADEVTGAVWLMQRLPGIEGGQSRQLLFGSVGFGIAALITALLAVFVTTEIGSGVHTVLERLGSMEGGLSAATSQTGGRPPLEEFDCVLHGIDSLALALHKKIENERTLESQVCHNERLSALGQFAAGIAHELRNPLGTIRMRTQMWQRSTDPEAAKRSSAVILEEIDRLDTIISRLLYFARPIHLQLQPVVLDDLCANAAGAWAEKRSGKGGSGCLLTSKSLAMLRWNQSLFVAWASCSRIVATLSIGWSSLVPSLDRVFMIPPSPYGQRLNIPSNCRKEQQDLSFRFWRDRSMNPDGRNNRVRGYLCIIS
jgi:signal transduction histidine kinase